MLIFRYYWFMERIRKAVKNGEHFIERETNNKGGRTTLPHPLLSLFPLLSVLIVAFIFQESLA